MKMLQSLAAVYIYIYIVGFNKTTLRKRSKAMYFKRM